MEYRENFLKYNDYFELRKSVGWNNFCKEQVIMALKNSQYDIVAYEGSQSIGMGRLVGDGIYFTIVDVVVKPKYQGKGVGSCIIRKIVDYAINITPSEGRISIQLIAEKGKEAFYEKMGFAKIPDQSCGSGMRRIVYK